MSTSRDEAELRQPPAHAETDIEVVAAGTISGAVAGAAAIVLSIVGLSGAYQLYMVTVATICAGGALLFIGASIAARYSKLLQDTKAGRLGSAELWSGMTAEFFGGTAGIVLGVLGVLNVSPLTLSAVAAIVFGATLVIGSGALSRLNNLEIKASGAGSTAQEIAREATKGGIDAQVLAGLAGITLGILALAGEAPLTLTLVAMLAIGASLVLGGSAIGSRMLTALR